MPLHEISGVGVPPGAELDYVEVTSNVSVTSTTEGTPDTVITGNNLTVNGSTAVMVQFFARGISSPSPAGGFLILNLHASTNGGSSYSDLGRIVAVSRDSDASPAGTITSPATGLRRLTPAAGTVIYRVVAWVSSTSGSPAVQAGAGGAATGVPMFLRVTRA